MLMTTYFIRVILWPVTCLSPISRHESLVIRKKKCLSLALLAGEGDNFLCVMGQGRYLASKQWGQIKSLHVLRYLKMNSIWLSNDFEIETASTTVVLLIS